MTRGLLLVGPMPPPVMGQSNAFRMLVEEVRARGIPHVLVDISPRRTGRPALSGFSLARARQLLAPFARFAFACARTRGTAYLQIAQSWPGFLRDLPFVWWAFITGHGIVLHLHGGNYDAFYRAQSRPRRALIRATLRRATRILVLSDRLRSTFAFDRTLGPRLRVVPNGLPDDAPELPAGRKRAPGAGPLRVAYVSSLIASKGYLDVLDAVHTLVADRKLDVELDLCGAFYPESDAEGNFDDAVATLRGAFEARVRAYGLGGRVRLRGVVSDDEKRAVLESCHVFALPTRYPNEGQPLAIVEAMAHGAVVVSTRYRAIPDLVEDGVTGALVEPGRPDLLAERIADVALDAERYERMSAAAREAVLARWTRERHLDVLLDALTLNRRPRAERAE